MKQLRKYKSTFCDIHKCTQNVRNVVRHIFFGFLLLNLSIGNIDAATIEDLESRIRQLETQRKELEEKGKAYGEELKKRHSEIASLNKEISTLIAQINRLKNDIALTGNKIEEAEVTIDKLNKEINTAEKSIDQKKTEIKQIIQELYRNEEEKEIIKIFKTTSFNDLVNELRYLNTLHEQLLVSLTEIKELKESLKENKSQMETKEVELKDFNQKQKIQKKALDEEKEYQASILKKTKGEEKKYKELFSGIEKQKAEFLKEIKKLELEVLRQKNFLTYTKGGVPTAGTKLFVSPQDNPRITQEYGMTSFAKRGAYGGSPHNGIDMSSGRGSEIKTIGDGKVIAAGRNKGWGNWIAIEHPIGLVSLYGHMISPTHRKVGDVVKAEDVIGYEGSTGYATGSHLHLSLYYEFFTFTNSRGELYFNYFEGTLNPLDYL